MINRKEIISHLKALGINACDERFTNWDITDYEDEKGTGGLWDLSANIIENLEKDELQDLIYWFLQHNVKVREDEK